VHMGEKRMHRRFWVDKTGRKRPLGRIMCSWEGNIVMDLITVQQDETYSVYYISVGSSTCFGC